jgi:signal transduction histidine kinase
MAKACFSTLIQALLAPQNKLLFDLMEQIQNLEKENHYLHQQVRQQAQALDQCEKDDHLLIEQRAQMQSHLTQMEKMSMLGQMVAGIAHEINNPITFIYGNLPYIEEHVQDLLKVLQAYQSNHSEAIAATLETIEVDFIQEDLPRIVDSMKLGADRVKTLVLTLRNFYRLDEPEMKPADLHTGIEDTLLLLQHRYKPDIEIIKKLGEIPPIACHINQINQVIMNLLSNAIDALLESNLDHPKQITIQTQTISADNLCISISDNGPGVPLEIQSRLFEPFFTTKQIGLGTGLGLSISHQIITETHGGKIYCCSAPGEGTTFRVELPIRHIPDLAIDEAVETQPET